MTEETTEAQPQKQKRKPGRPRKAPAPQATEVKEAQATAEQPTAEQPQAEEPKEQEQPKAEEPLKRVLWWAPKAEFTLPVTIDGKKVVLKWSRGWLDLDLTKEAHRKVDERLGETLVAQQNKIRRIDPRKKVTTIKDRAMKRDRLENMDVAELKMNVGAEALARHGLPPNCENKTELIEVALEENIEI